MSWNFFTVGTSAVATGMRSESNYSHRHPSHFMPVRKSRSTSISVA